VERKTPSNCQKLNTLVVVFGHSPLLLDIVRVCFKVADTIHVIPQDMNLLPESDSSYTLLPVIIKTSKAHN